MKNKALLLLFSLMAWVGCQKAPDDLIYAFEHFDVPTAEEFSVEQTPELNFSKICVFDDLILLSTEQEEDRYFFHLYSLEGKYLASFGDKDETTVFYQPVCFCQSIQQQDSTLLVTYDHGSNLIHLIDIKAVLAGSTKAIIAESITAPDMFMPKGVYINQANQSVLGLGGGEHGVFFNYKIPKRELYWSPEKPNVQKNHLKNTVDLIYTANSSIDPMSGIISVAYVLFNRIDQYDLNGQFLRSVYYQTAEHIEPKVRDGFPSNTNTVYYTSIKSGYGHHYLLYRGRELSDDNAAFKTQIHVLDEAGNPVRAYQLPFYVIDFSVLQNNKLLAIVPSDETANNHLFTINIEL